MYENNWWKSPVLQGPENDYGDLDYLLEELPRNTREWTKWQYKCSECGKWQIGISKFCPNCGAKMDLEEEDK